MIKIQVRLILSISTQCIRLLQIVIGWHESLISTSKIPLANGKSLWRTCKIIGNPVKNGNQLKIHNRKQKYKQKFINWKINLLLN